MPDAVTDTHALIWYLQDDARLSSLASHYFDDCERDSGRIHVPSICLIEIIYLLEKGRIPPNTLTMFLADIQSPDTVLDIVDLNLPIILEARNVPRATVPDMPDRIIAATALHLALPLISRDSKIQLSSVTTIW
jgi:PIN domain nuclease of toxin-antitoxin system